jgi:hypothetical protein
MSETDSSFRVLVEKNNSDIDKSSNSNQNRTGIRESCSQYDDERIEIV